MVELVNLLSRVEMFSGLNEEQLTLLASIFKERTLGEGEVLFQQGAEGNGMGLICEGFIEVVDEADDEGSSRTLVTLGSGQSVGEMALIDRGPRSATARAVGGRTVVAWVGRADFEQLCESNTAIGYVIMRNIAADLSFRLRHRDLDASRHRGTTRGKDSTL